MSFSDFRDLVHGSNGKCQLTGIALSIKLNAKIEKGHQPFGLSIDRIDPSRPYVIDNCRVVCSAVNIALFTWGEGVFSAIARAYVAKNVQESGITIVDNPQIYDVKEQLDTNNRDHNPLIRA